MFLAAILSLLAPGAFAAECAQGLKESSPVSTIGAFSDMRYTEEHAYGYVVEL